MGLITSVSPRTVAALGAAFAAAALAIASSFYLHGVMTGPAQTYSNERGMLAVIYFGLALGFAVGSLAAVWSRRASGSLLVRIISFGVLAWLSVVLAYASVVAT